MLIEAHLHVLEQAIDCYLITTHPHATLPDEASSGWRVTCESAALLDALRALEDSPPPPPPPPPEHPPPPPPEHPPLPPPGTGERAAR